MRLDLPLRLLVELVDDAGLPPAIARGWTHIIETELLPLAGELRLDEVGAADLELLLVCLRERGIPIERRLLCHYALVQAYDIATALQWTTANPALGIPPV